MLKIASKTNKNPFVAATGWGGAPNPAEELSVLPQTTLPTLGHWGQRIRSRGGGKTPLLELSTTCQQRCNSVDYTSPGTAEVMRLSIILSPDGIYESCENDILKTSFGCMMRDNSTPGQPHARTNLTSVYISRNNLEAHILFQNAELNP